MKKIAAIAVFILGILPLSSSAAVNITSPGMYVQSPGTPIFSPSGAVPAFSFKFGTYPNTPFQYILSPNLSLSVLNAATPIIPITGLALSCVPYNSALAGVSGYPYATETLGISGGVVTVSEYFPNGSTFASVAIGTIILANSPHGGPYVNTATTTLGSPYTPMSGTIISAWISTLGSNTIEGYADCTVTLVE